MNTELFECVIPDKKTCKICCVTSTLPFIYYHDWCPVGKQQHFFNDVEKEKHIKKLRSKHEFYSKFLPKKYTDNNINKLTFN